jgi:membrane fusion protein, multidrug efflux system
MNATAELAHHAAPAPLGSKPAPLPHQSHAAAAKPRRRAYGRNVAFAAVILGVLGWGVHFAVHAYHYEGTDDAFVAGHLHTISAQVDGQVKEVLVEDNQLVHAGDVLLRLDPLQFQIAVEKANAAVTQANAQVQQLTAATAQADATAAETRARVTQAEAQRTQTAAQLELANLTLRRNQQLFQANGTAQAELDQVRNAAQAAEAAHHAAEANLLAAQAAVKSAEAAQASAHAQTEAARAAVGAAEAALHDAQRQLAYTTITAPADGRVGNKHVEPGNRIQAGQALFALAEENTWVVANFKETQLARMHVGQPVELTIDAVPDAALHGRVDSVSPASGAQFALLPPDNATGNFNKVVQRIPVKITFDPESRAALGDRLRLGLSAIVDVRVR